MKYLTLIMIIFIFNNLGFSQLSNDFFPNEIGFRWTFKITPLDTNGNQMTHLQSVRIDTFLSRTNFQNKDANVILSKLNETLPFYLDTNFVHLETTNAWLYTKLFPNIDSIKILDTLGLIKIFSSFIGWHNYFRFNQTVNIEYVIVSKDTTINIGETNYKIRIKISGKRLNDELISVPSGNYYCKKFVINYSINLILFSIEIPIVVFPDTNWITNSLWIVKEIQPPVKIDLSTFNLGRYYIYGMIRELTSYKLPSLVAENDFISSFKLYQNYPNPFNTSTIIKFKLFTSAYTSLKIYNILGVELSTLINKHIEPGEYQIIWDAENLPAGVYYYRLISSNQLKTQKAILIK